MRLANISYHLTPPLKLNKMKMLLNFNNCIISLKSEQRLFVNHTLCVCVHVCRSWAKIALDRWNVLRRTEAKFLYSTVTMNKEQLIHQSSYSSTNLKSNQFCSSLGFKWLLMQKQMMKKFHVTVHFGKLLESLFFLCNAFAPVYLPTGGLASHRQIISYILHTYMSNCYDTFLIILLYLGKNWIPFKAFTAREPVLKAAFIFLYKEVAVITGKQLSLFMWVFLNTVTVISKQTK